jgi:opacity protein-like surface antigen
VRELSIWFLFLTLFSLFPMTSLAGYSFELVPRISVSQVYDDNIYLDNINEKSDYLTTLSPGINLTISSLSNSLSLDYAPTWVWYDEYDENDTVRQAATLAFWQNMAEHLRFDLTDTYLKTEEPIEETEEVEGVRTTRNTYQRNTGSASLRYQFGPEDTIALGYRNNLLENEDPTLDDGTIQIPFCSISYWFNVKNGLELNYEFTKAIFWRDDDSLAGDNYQGHAAGLRYNYRFTPHTRGSIGYNFTNRNFEGLTEDYKIQEGSVSFEHAFSPDLSVSIGGGYFIQQNEISDDEPGYSYDASLAKRFERGSFTIGGRGGWDEAYLEAERRGFIRFWSANTRLDYRIIEPLSLYAGASYRQDKDPTDREWKTWRGNCGLRWAFLRWFSLSLDYSYAERDDDVDTEDYSVNRVMLLLTATKPERL